MRLNKLISIFVMVSILLATQSCGWRLRGSIDLPEEMRHTFLQGAALYSELGLAIKSSLEGAEQAQLTSDKASATAILIISKNEVSQRVLTYDSLNRASEYELKYELKFKLQDNSGKVLLAEQTVSTIRELQLDPNNVLSTSDEEARLRKDMINFAVSQMLRRINVSLGMGIKLPENNEKASADKK
ncbi:MAG: LPS assembly lipoprotein LptE [Gammaproteobacteria bacterium]|nr:LPS assembly lipoprotein LptE [Gammaproteobacteria bacterium]MDH5778923.1 LPS assembly lipoprotein LptE [Gammaproteobacteria bacterium]